MFVLMLIASALLIAWGALLVLTGDYIATLDIAATLVSAGVIAFCLALLTRTLAALPAQIARHTAALTKTLTSPSAAGLPAENTLPSADVSTITKAIAKATAAPQSSFRFPESAASPQPPLPLPQDKKVPDFKASAPPVAEPERARAPETADTPSAPVKVQPPQFGRSTPAVYAPKPRAPEPASSSVAPHTHPAQESETAEPAVVKTPVQRPTIPLAAASAATGIGAVKATPAPEPVPEPQLNHTAAPASTTAAPDVETTLPNGDEERAFLREGNIDGVTYRFYSDGSAETDTPEGTRFFASIEEVRDSILLSRVSFDLSEETLPDSEPLEPSFASAFTAQETDSLQATETVSIPESNWNIWPTAPTSETAPASGHKAPSPFDFSVSRSTAPESTQSSSASGLDGLPVNTPARGNDSASLHAAVAHDFNNRSINAENMSGAPVPSPASRETSPLDHDEWAEPFRMLLRKDKNPGNN